MPPEACTQLTCTRALRSIRIRPQVWSRPPQCRSRTTMSAMASCLWQCGQELLIAWALSWAALRWFLWRPGRILRRQYEVRQVRVTEEKAAKRRQR